MNPHFCLHTSLRCPIALIANHNEGKFAWLTTISLSKELCLPFFEIFKRLNSMSKRYLWVGNVKDENTAICSLVKCTPKTFESFLSCRVPNLKGNIPIIHCHLFGHKISTNCCSIVLCKLLIDISNCPKGITGSLDRFYQLPNHPK